MFDELDKQANLSAPSGPAAPKAPAPGRTEDIFAEVDKSDKPEVFNPKPAGTPYETVIPADETWLKNKGLIFGALGGIFVILAGGFLVLKFFINAAPAADLTGVAPADNIQTEAKTAAPVSSQENNPAQPAAQAAQTGQPAETAEPDSDRDGLTDAEEAQFGTDANQPDSDGDGLTDREEAKVYHTDPLKADTDGDGYPDGQEVKNGFNPNGAGKLLNAGNQENNTPAGATY